MKETHTQFSGFLDSFGDNLVKKGYFKINTSCDFSSGNWINPTERKKIWCSEGFMWAKGCSVQYDFENDKEMIEDLKSMDKFEREHYGNKNGIKINLGTEDREGVGKVFERLGLLHLTY